MLVCGLAVITLLGTQSWAERSLCDSAPCQTLSTLPDPQHAEDCFRGLALSLKLEVRKYRVGEGRHCIVIEITAPF